ncbi:MAG: hypothetical protein D6785_07000 [Planctomycetota bacterium]|nr:MAG: hypothetical protein D6785_07000 [Planctomycetota bacterium]
MKAAEGFQKYSLFLVFCFILVSLSCASSNWWDDPPQMEGKITAVGMARYVGNDTLSRTAAEANAKRVLAGFVKTQIQALTETWGKQAGNDQVASSVSNYFNDENITRDLINTTLHGAIPLKYAKHGKYQYVLMAIDTKKFAQYWKNAASKALEAKKVLLQSQAMKEDYAKRMDKIIEEYLARVAKGIAAK